MGDDDARLDDGREFTTAELLRAARCTRSQFARLAAVYGLQPARVVPPQSRLWSASTLETLKGILAGEEGWRS